MALIPGPDVEESSKSFSATENRDLVFHKSFISTLLTACFSLWQGCGVSGTMGIDKPLTGCLILHKGICCLCFLVWPPAVEAKKLFC